ncbi:MAG: hypothetical protein SF029_01900 [bacterium]|nr:hypothetical protein [bacterium]
MHKFSRRHFLQMTALGVLGHVLPFPHNQNTSAADSDPLRQSIADLIGDRQIGLDLRRLNPDASEDFRIQINADSLYPVASCFKAFLVLYYLWYTPRDQWQTGEDTPLHSVAVYSNNVQTGYVIDEVGRRLSYYGNTIQKFNDFLLYILNIQNGMYSWDWENTPTAGYADERFAPSSRRFINHRGEAVQMENLFTARDFADFYTRLIQPAPFPDYPFAQEAVQTTLDLLSIAAESYQSPIERAFPQGYTGKDGVLPASDSAIGRVINDAGILNVAGTNYVLAFFCAGEGEYLGINLLRQIAPLLEALENQRG